MAQNKLNMTICMACMVFCFSTAIASVECTLTMSNHSYEKIISCSGPKVLSYTWQASAGGTGFGYVRLNCDIYIDGQKLNKTHCFTYYNYSGYYSQAWQYQDAKTQHIYLSSGSHTVKWSISVPNWMDTYNPQVSVIDYTLAAIPSYDSLYDWAKATYEDETWIANSLSGVIENYDATISANPADYEARISRALAKVAQLGDNTTLRSLIAQFGFIPDDFMQYATGEFAGFDNIPQPNAVVDAVGVETVSAIDSALLDLSEIPEDWSGVIALTPEKYSMLSDTTYIDNAELMMLRSALNAVRGLVQLVDGYDFSADYVTVSNAYARSSQHKGARLFFDIFGAMPDVGNVRDLQKMSYAKECFRSALQYLQKTDSAIVARDDGLTHFLEYDSADADDIIEARKVLDKVIASLDEVTTIDGRYFADKYGSTIDLPNGFVRQLYLGALFAGQVTRDCIGRVLNEEEFDDFKYLTDVVDMMRLVPDPTFGGVAPDVTISEVVSVYVGSQYFKISDYMSVPIRLKLPAGVPVVVEGVAVRDGNVTFHPVVPGFANCYVDGQCVAQTASGEYSFQALKGQRYAVMFTPTTSMIEAIKPVIFSSVPSPLPGSGQYIITFDANGGECAEALREVMKGNGVGVLPTPVRDGYNFDGWYTEPGGGTKITSATKITKDTFFYAHWSAKIELVLADGCNGMGMVSGGGVIAAGKKVTLKATAKKGYVFAGWYDGAGNPLSGGVDYRTATYPYVSTGEPAAITARFVPAEADAAEENIVFAISGTAGVYAAGEAIEQQVTVSSFSIPTVTVTGLPAGLKFDAKALKITGKPTKPGELATATFTIKNQSNKTGKKETVTYRIGDATSGLLDDLKYNTVPGEDGYALIVPGVETDMHGLLGLDPGDLAGWTITGLPAGLKFDSRTGTFSGKATQSGKTYLVTFKKGAEIATITLGTKPDPKLTLTKYLLVRDDIAPEVEDGTYYSNFKLTGGGNYQVGKKVSVSATAPKNWMFVGWASPSDFNSKDNTVRLTMVSTDAKYTFSMPSPDDEANEVELTAVFTHIFGSAIVPDDEIEE